MALCMDCYSRPSSGFHASTTSIKPDKAPSPLSHLDAIVPGPEIDLAGRSLGVVYAGSVIRLRARDASELYVHRS
jgi:hypothetical protein